MVINPSVIEDTDLPRNCWDTFAASLNPNTNYYTLPYIIAGYHSSYGTNKAYVRWETLPSLPVGADINKVELKLNMYMDLNDQTTVQVKQITSPWNLTALTWNKQPSVGTKVIHSQTGNTNGSWNFDITSLAKEWYEGTAENNGIQLAANPENANRRSFRSSNHTDDRPVLRINYTLEPMGLQSFWGYAGNTNVLNGNLVVSATDAALLGRGVPIGVSRTYNSRSTEASVLGYGWTSNVGMHISFADGSSVKLVDGTGSSYYFTLQPDGTYKPPVGIYYELTKESGLYVLKDSEGVKYYFDAKKQLDKVVDPQGNITDIVRNADGLISHVVDPSKRYIEFSYSGATLQDKRLDTITMNATPGAYPTSPATEPVVSYTYDAEGNLASVTKVNEGENIVVGFGYAEHKLTSITDPMGARTEITYDSDKRVETITKHLEASTSGVLSSAGYGSETTTGVDSVSTHFSYQPRGAGQTGYAMVTTVTDPRGIKTVYYSSDQGNVVKIVKNPGANEEKYEMEWGEMQNLRVIKDPKGKDTVMGYDTQGNLLSIRNPTGASAIYHYNTDGDVVSASDFAGRSVTISYDDKRQVVVSTNHQSASSATDRDKNGNVSSETIPMTLAENLLLNSGFEAWPGTVPTGWQNVTLAPGTVTNDADNRMSGNRAVKIQGVTESSSGYGRLLQTDYVPVQPLGRYAASWWVKTSKMGADGAGLVVHWYNSAKAWRSTTPLLEPVTGTADWTRQIAMVDAPADAAFVRVELRLKSAGTAWYDNIQLECGTAVNAANLLTNAGFEVNTDSIPHLPDGWWSNTLTAAEGVTTAEKYSGSNSVLVNSDSISHNFGLGVDTTGEDANGVAGTTVTFSGWVKTENLTSATRARLRLKLVYADDGSIGWVDALSTAGTHGWEYVENTVVLPKNVSKWAVYGWVPATSDRGKVYFDDFSLRHSYGHGAEGNNRRCRDQVRCLLR